MHVRPACQSVTGVTDSMDSGACCFHFSGGGGGGGGVVQTESCDGSRQPAGEASPDSVQCIGLGPCACDCRGARCRYISVDVDYTQILKEPAAYGIAAADVENLNRAMQGMLRVFFDPVGDASLQESNAELNAFIRSSGPEFLPGELKDAVAASGVALSRIWAQRSACIMSLRPPPALLSRTSPASPLRPASWCLCPGATDRVYHLYKRAIPVSKAQPSTDRRRLPLVRRKGS